ncbi:electron transport complex RnfABCDGE type C subunit [Zymomonas mobilis subsp. mobilis ZM4 = ATCC 31821]|uniref:Ion-translocating oxidoreductase complex subunit C n=1 Tax=Zymomonas mobilis subsp. mobilis (strain ATCC 31821 / ZM4 / CP4) TaxID=264203 RepID=Q5NLH4_ZYMMO|nr:electron transport complex subunit RsxC [Zymomonas mobilis]AAV90436.1 electron transport complex, RnfABCDGE type, C subunit [Zymomonas mobilis subsp. mobilis ZM4 = ATCC 31821]AVZ26618.1 electron transport complex RnfABCDGE type C subunit [Zymomonas mobilis subsp. mobilis]AVZ28504.1 electron transport complex RnfABCDGE type C subunit [Zymomonas mobilis subsp. mobilis]AVZ42950.1 electron transport complex RnfABCDGE type C subunit [Zymomonas mobilis subsp. mobilis ZM4 = ATCC 31821]UBQ07706.1 e
MKLFSVRGGIHPSYRKQATTAKKIEPLPIVPFYFLPLRQHSGAPAEAVVNIGDHVGKGQLLAAPAGRISAPIHAPTSGIIRAIQNMTAPHPSGLPGMTMVLEADGKDSWAELPEAYSDPFAVDPQLIRERVAWAGVVGLGGAAFPAAVKLEQSSQKPIKMVVLNGAECEPYLTGDDRVMQEYADEVISGGRLIAHAVGAPKVVIGIERNKPEALAIMKKTAEAYDNVEIADLPAQYPVGSARHLVQALTGLEISARTRIADVGVLVQNVGTARAVWRSARYGEPLISRIVTVSGGGMNDPKTLDAPIGSPVKALIDFCGGMNEKAEQIVTGGPLMGVGLPNIDVPVIKGTAGILALTSEEMDHRPTEACLRCGRCVDVCPCGLSPVEMASLIRRDKLEEVEKLQVMDCFSCGSCSYVCPSHLPLVQYFNYAKGEIWNRRDEERKQNKIKALAAAKEARLAEVLRQRQLAAERAKAAKAAANKEEKAV